MTVPCESKDDIIEMQKAIAAIGNNGHSLEGAIVRMVQAQERQTLEMREMTSTITAHMVDNREFRLNLERGKEERDLLFKKVRKLDDDDHHLTALVHNQDLKVSDLKSSCEVRWLAIEPLPKRLENIEKFQNRLVGGLFIIPSICTVISLFLAIMVFMRT